MQDETNLPGKRDKMSREEKHKNRLIRNFPYEMDSIKELPNR